MKKKFSIYGLSGLLSRRFREKRFKWFLDTMRPDARSTLLDIGGYPWSWQSTEVPAKIVIVNLHEIPGMAEQVKNRFELVTGDGCKLAYADGAFDIVFSNSVIEHVGSYERQQKFAAEARRVGRALWIQTPAREFFFEPHLLTPFIHFFSRSMQERLLRHFTVWGLMTRPSQATVRAFLDETRLLRYEEMRELFPDCEIFRERFMGMTKSYVAVRT
ncbi:MAG: methyltransferase domain-containing protein [Nevskiales bacterium]